jgi:predicted dehydrogenase
MADLGVEVTGGLHDPIRFGIIGAGVIGPAHAAAIASLPEAELVCVADPVPGRAESLAERHGARAYANVDAMLEQEALDVVNVCTPSGMHAEHACQAMRRGRHVMVEKPLGITAQSIEAMLRVQQDMEVKLAAIYQKRFEAGNRDVHDLLEESRFGRLVLGAAHLPAWRSQAYYDSGAWRGTWEWDGGGVLMNQGIHMIDLLLWFMGPVHSVCAHTDTLVRRMEAEDVGSAVLRFESGAEGTISATTCAFPGLPTRIEIHGDAGSAVLEDDRLVALLTAADCRDVPPTGLSGESRDRVQSATLPVEKSECALDAHTLQIRDMIQALREGLEPLVNGIEGRQAVDLILAIYESARTGCEIGLS